MTVARRSFSPFSLLFLSGVVLLGVV